ncbi:MAG: cation:proton antiporter [Candidatus Omnitrophica bacterium]|jgi:Kef-type K+ transport system membrane component KefB|nr:cation:proton antiporter [Candidatus Omnitrophota bacterium]
MIMFAQDNIFIFLLQVFLLLGFARLLGEIFRRFKQPTLTAEILVGILFGPTVFGRFFPKAYNFVFPQDPAQLYMLETVALMGLLFFLLETGLGMDFSAAWRHRGNALKIASSDIIFPMFMGFVLSLFIPDSFLVDPSQRIIFALFMATVMTISAMPVTIRALNDLNISKTDLGYLIMSALSVNEIIGWVIFTLVLAVFTNTNVHLIKLVMVLASAIILVVFCLSYGRRLSEKVINFIKKSEMPEPASSLTFLCLAGFFCGALFQRIGISAMLGFFAAGVMAGEAKALPERTRQVISQMVYAIFVPLFFASIGLNIDFLHNFNLKLIIFITFVSFFGKFIGAWIGVIFTKLSRANRLSVAVAHTPGGSMEIVIGILALQYNLITEQMFVAIVASGVTSATLLGPLLKYSLMLRKKISVMECFSHKEIILDMKAKDRDSAIYELCSLASEQGNMPDAERIYAPVLARENMMGTAIEEGIALPHARINFLMHSRVILGRAKSGIEWNSPDGNPAKFIFLILTPKQDDEAQVQILGIIARVMSDQNNRKKFLAADSQHEIWQALQELFAQQHIYKKKKHK